MGYMYVFLVNSEIWNMSDFGIYCYYKLLTKTLKTAKLRNNTQWNICDKSTKSF